MRSGRCDICGYRDDILRFINSYFSIDFNYCSRHSTGDVYRYADAIMDLKRMEKHHDWMKEGF